MHAEHHEKQTESILNYLEEPSFHCFEKMKERFVYDWIIMPRMPPKRMSTSEAPVLTHATIEKLVAHSVATVLEAQAAIMAKKLQDYQLSNINGTPEAVGSFAVFNAPESIFSRSKCAEKNKVRFVVSTLTKEALFWWNSFTQSIGIEEAYKITSHESELQLNDKLNFIEEPVEIMDREVKQLKQSRIPIIKVRWNSNRGPEFTWERKDEIRAKYPHL
ncbi:hypothetical protein Tco_1315277, partial [Tanacetum coccineum]